MLLVFDENYSPYLAEGLGILEKANDHSPYKVDVSHIISLAGKRGTPDEAVIEIVGRNKGIVLTQDTDFRKLKHSGPLFKQHKTGAIFFHSTSRKMIFWDMVVSFINNWERIKEIAHMEKPPFVYKIGIYGGVQKQHF